MKNFCLTQTSEGKKGMRLSMEYITTGDAVQKWNISERRIRKYKDFVKLINKLNC